MCGILWFRLFISFVLGEVGLESLCQLAAGQHDASATAFALQPNIGTEANNRPLVGTAWMLFAQAQVIVELQVRKHRGKPGSLDRIDDEDYILNYDKLRTKNPPFKLKRTYAAT